MNADAAQNAVVRDAGNRAWRTLLQGLAVDVAAAVGVALTAALVSGVAWTRAYWLALILAVGKSAVMAMLSYMARVLIPPATAPTTRGGAVP